MSPRSEAAQCCSSWDRVLASRSIALFTYTALAAANSLPPRIMKIKLDPSIALAFLTCYAQPAASPARALSHLAFIQRARALIREDERIGAG